MFVSSIEIKTKQNMTLRDLTPEQTLVLIKRCKHDQVEVMARLTAIDDLTFESIFDLGFDRGLKAGLEFVPVSHDEDTVPNKDV